MLSNKPHLTTLAAGPVLERFSDPGRFLLEHQPKRKAQLAASEEYTFFCVSSFFLK